ncbi:phosphotransferase enzyme family protein [Histoplasma capsulatum var. duboisii H88]|uniref:Phosphotransferase enzyme family protein n=1 Tax=Ajellomyces capsulatus (strain H88) TaxID=544711 RepID=A0A8A1LKW9_AJEC8|nr:phosphotransferase enzyme family protein [Histoplasma capsulatum var. duboisii H88]
MVPNILHGVLTARKEDSRTHNLDQELLIFSMQECWTGGNLGSKVSELMSHIKDLVTSRYLTLATSHYVKPSNALINLSTASLV